MKKHIIYSFGSIVANRLYLDYDYVAGKGDMHRPTVKYNFGFLNLLSNINKNPSNIKLNRKDALRILWMLISNRFWGDDGGCSDKIEYYGLIKCFRNTFRKPSLRDYKIVDTELRFVGRKWHSNKFVLELFI